MISFLINNSFFHSSVSMLCYPHLANPFVSHSKYSKFYSTAEQCKLLKSFSDHKIVDVINVQSSPGSLCQKIYCRGQGQSESLPPAPIHGQDRNGSQQTATEISSSSSTNMHGENPNDSQETATRVPSSTSTSINMTAWKQYHDIATTTILVYRLHVLLSRVLATSIFEYGKTPIGSANFVEQHIPKKYQRVDLLPNLKSNPEKPKVECILIIAEIVQSEITVGEILPKEGNQYGVEHWPHVLKKPMNPSLTPCFFSKSSL